MTTLNWKKHIKSKLDLKKNRNRFTRIWVHCNFFQKGKFILNKLNKSCVYKKSNKEIIRSEIINFLIKNNDYRTYLEIGVADGNNFKKIHCKKKISVDPGSGRYHFAEPTFKMTSDQFFKKNKEKFDLIFIDGLHEFKQVERDINNSLKCLAENGTVVCHDLNPLKEKDQLVPRQADIWNGDCWKAFVKLRMKRSDLEMTVIDTDYGVGIIKRGSQERIKAKNLTYQNLQKNRKKWLNLVSLKKFKKNFKNKPHKIIITGTGRAGTTFLVRLLTELGLDTGYEKEKLENLLDKNSNAGLEDGYCKIIKNETAPYVVKSPEFCTNLKIMNKKFHIDAVLVPFRDLEDASQSRINIGASPGGLWLTDKPEKQKEVLGAQITQLFNDLKRYKMPYIILDFPFFLRNSKYTYDKLQPFITGVSFQDFERIFLKLNKLTKSNYYKK